ncbi:MAG: hypothetical protein AAF467_03465 [Actinomycetota bacterium]
MTVAVVRLAQPRGLCVATALLLTIAACGGADDPDPAAPNATDEEVTAAAAVSDSAAQGADDGSGDGGIGGTASGADWEPIRADDVLDVAVLASTIAADATGDPKWIDVVADLRARSWLVSRYPGEYDLAAIYADPWLADEATEPDAERVAEAVWLDEPLPTLRRVVERAQIGELVQIDVTLDAGDAVIRRNVDDGAIGSLPGGPSRGFFFLSEEPDGSWRIHSLMQTCLVLADEASPEEDAATC